MHPNYNVIIGLEVHAQLNTRSKAWCSCEVSISAPENALNCPVCTAQPGSLPVANKKVVQYAAMIGLATHCKINEISFFDRKNYFYPDLPKGYQITQFEKPLAEDGFLTIRDDNGVLKKIGIERVQIEEDTGKSLHEGGYSLINLNRCGTPLIEIVGRPDIRTPSEASQYLKKLHAILVYLGVSNGNLQEGNFRCDVNVSIHPKGSETWGTRTEVKNLNSFRNVEKAIVAEVKRQAEMISSGQKVQQQTLNYDALKDEITVLRTKSSAHDYRYFPEPDLLPVVVGPKDLEAYRNLLPELPDQKITRFQEQYTLPLYDAEILGSEKALADYFEQVVSACKAPAKKVSNWIMVELLRLLNEYGLGVEKSRVSFKELAVLLTRVEEGKISGNQAKEVFLKMFDESLKADETIKLLGMEQVSDEGPIREAVKKVLESNPVELEAYRGGKVKLFGFFVGQVMKEMQGKGNPGMINEILKSQLSS
jgi:aspartyl-tRNA(Asn)/glutamyl-tRNA(Gln) amidotransferase subunit B